MRRLSLALTIIRGIFDLFAIPIRAFFRPRRVGYQFATLTVEANVLTKRRLEQSAEALGCSQFTKDQLQALLTHLVTRLGERKVQILPISNLGDDVNDLDGTGVAGSIRVFAIVLKKQATATAAYYKLFDDATNSGTAADNKVIIPLLESSKEACLLFPDGLPLTDGIVQTSQTTSNATVDSTSGDGPNGFMVVG